MNSKWQLLLVHHKSFMASVLFTAEVSSASLHAVLKRWAYFLFKSNNFLAKVEKKIQRSYSFKLFNPKSVALRTLISVGSLLVGLYKIDLRVHSKQRNLGQASGWVEVIIHYYSITTSPFFSSFLSMGPEFRVMGKKNKTV